MDRFWTSVGIFVCGAIACICVIGFIAGTQEKLRAKDCELMGMTMLDGKPYQCAAMPSEAKR